MNMFFGCIIRILIFWTACNVHGIDIKVQVKQGLLEGERVQTVLGDYYYSFKGIPFAKPPVGELRFKAPRDPEPWDGVRNAKAHGLVCPQVQAYLNEYYPGSEDCLFLNVYTANLTPDTPLAVIVVVPAGIYQYGSGNVDMYAPDFLVSSNIIVVTINYRVDVLGFISLGTPEVPGNAALKDQVAALKWIQNNIQYFGGDPTKVTLYGESSSSACVGYHMLSPMSKGLFHRAIVMSGSPYCGWNTAYKPEKRAFKLGQTLGFKTNDKSQLLNFLRSVPSKKLVNTSCELLRTEIERNSFKMVQFPPVVEGPDSQENFLPDDPAAIIKSGKVNKVDVLFSLAGQEAVLALDVLESYLLEYYNRYKEIFVPTKILLNSSPDKVQLLADKIIKDFFGNKTINKENMVNFLNYAGGAVFGYCTQKFAREWPQVGNVYFMKFSSFSNRNYYGNKGVRYGIKEATHGDDILYLFDPKSINLTLTKNSREYKLIQQTVIPITNFVKYGNPTPDSSLGVIWPKFNTSTLAYMHFTDNLTVKYGLEKDTYQYWDDIFEEAGFSFAGK